MATIRLSCGMDPRHIISCLWIFEVFLFFFVVPSYLDFKRPYGFIPYKDKSDSYSVWRSVQLDSPDFLDKKTSIYKRHGQPLRLYFETGTYFTNLTYGFPRRIRSSLTINCTRVVQKGWDEQNKPMGLVEVDEFLARKENQLEKELNNCSNFVNDMGYVMDPLTTVEKEFPIAYSMLVFRDFVQVEMLLRAIYRPQNLYCIHVDLKSDSSFRSNIETLADCFDNVFLTHRSVNVKWGGFTVLEPEIICLEELWEKSAVKWKYWINLTGQEFPLRTNYELVKILKAFNGANNVEGERDPGIVYRRLIKSGFPPHRLDPVKGAIHVVLSRDFVDYVLHNETARDLLDWSREVLHPDEIFFSTLNYSPDLRIPGSYKGTDETNVVTNPFFARFKNWYDEWYCYGKQVRGICVFAMGDLPLLSTREEMFANKFHLRYSTETLYCMEELIYNRTLEEYHGVLDFNVSYYGSRDFVNNKF